MSDELDPELLRLFVEADQPLPDADFRNRVNEALNRPQGWRDVVRALAEATRAVLSGVAIGIAAPFRIRTSRLGLMAASGTALVIWATLQMVQS
jgi:hypothetical protein